MRKRSKTSGNNRELLQSVTKTLELLETFTRKGPELSVAQLLEMLAVPKGTLYRMLHTLEAKGFIVRNAQTGNYRPGIKVWEIGCKSLETLGLRQVAPPIMEELVSVCKETALLAILDGTDVVYIEVVDAPQILRFHGWLGQRVPAHATGTGKVLLAFAEPDCVEQVIAQGLPRFTPTTVTNRAALLRELATIRQQGYAFGGGDWIEDVRGVTAPVYKSGGQVVAALGVGGPATRFTPEHMQVLIPLVLRAAQNLSHALGYEGIDP
jgi:DNA-binding IclR family transcriptional regulator